MLRRAPASRRRRTVCASGRLQAMWSGVRPSSSTRLIHDLMSFFCTVWASFMISAAKSAHIAASEMRE